MKVEDVRLDKSKSQSLIEIKLFQDQNGNYFAEYTTYKENWVKVSWTSTYTIAGQAVSEALHKINLGSLGG